MVSVPAKKRMKSRAYPDIEVLQEVPEELNPLADTRGEASLRGHLKAEGDEQIGSQSYIHPDPKDDKALHTALDLIRGTQKNLAYLLMADFVAKSPKIDRGCGRTAATVRARRLG